MKRQPPQHGIVFDEIVPARDAEGFTRHGVQCCAIEIIFAAVAPSILVIPMAMRVFRMGRILERRQLRLEVVSDRYDIPGIHAARMRSHQVGVGGQRSGGT